jgi:hypothetical protein
MRKHHNLHKHKIHSQGYPAFNDVTLQPASSKECAAAKSMAVTWIEEPQLAGSDCVYGSAMQ